MEECFSWTLVLCLLAITGSVPASATEFSCYQCTYTKNGGTVIDKACNDPFKTAVYRFPTATGCTTSCYKMVSKTRTGDERVERGCFIPSATMPTCSDSNYHDGFNSGSMSCCTGEGCNGVESRGNLLPSVSSSTTTLASTTVPATKFNCFRCTYTKNGSSVINPGCKDPFNTTVYRFHVAANCLTSCYKMVSKTGTGDERVERGCFIPSATLPTCSDSKYDDGSKSGSLSCCQGEGCNGAQFTGNPLTNGLSSTTTLASTTVPATKFNCFKCKYTKAGSTVVNKDCNDPLKTTPYRFFVAANCRTSCYKLVSKTGAGDEKVERDCFIPTATMPTCSDSKFDDGSNSGSLSCCKGEGCNA